LLQGIANQLPVIGHIANNLVFSEEFKALLLITASLEQLSDGSQSKGIVAEGYLAGPVNLPAAVTASQGLQAYKHTQTLDTSALKHRLGPSMSPGTYKPAASQQPCRSVFNLGDLLVVDMFIVSAESARIALDMNGYLFHPQVEYAYYPPIPSYPNLSAKVLRSH